MGAFFVRLFTKLKIENAPDLGELGRVIIAPNHVSFLDPPVLQYCLRYHVTFMMTEGIFRLRFMKWFFKLWGVIPVPDGGSATTAMRSGVRAIELGRPLVIFPEGRISTDGKLNAGRGGVAVLMMKTGVPVIPVAILGTFEVLPKSKRWPRRGPVTVRFGTPIPPPSEGTDPRAYAQAIMDAIASLGAPRRGESTEDS